MLNLGIEISGRQLIGELLGESVQLAVWLQELGRERLNPLFVALELMGISCKSCCVSHSVSDTWSAGTKLSQSVFYTGQRGMR